MATYIVTGSSGFVGTHLVARLADNGHQVIAVDQQPRAGNEEIDEPRVTRVYFDLVDVSELAANLPSRPDAVFHLAAQTSGEGSFDDPEADLRSNALGTQRILEWSLANGAKRFVLASSMAVYGNQPSDLISESATPMPTSFYGISKLAAEHYARHYMTQGLDVTILRMSNIYGPGQNMSDFRQGMMSIYLAYMLNDIPIDIKGSLERFRDFIYIDDVLDVWEKIPTIQQTANQVYNLGTGKITTVRQLINGLSRIWSGDENAYPRRVLDGTIGDQSGIVADIARLSADLEWVPTVTLDKGMQSFVEWVRS
jgi:UDP-glucose 4-epimerase